MKRVVIFLFGIIACMGMQAQSKRSISILGDSYSTFKGYVVPDTNAVWYPQKPENNDVQDIRQLWWHQLIREHGYRLCQNNSFSGATICNTGYDREDYSDRSFCTRLWYLGDPAIILMFGGTNDSWAHSPIGDYQYGDWEKSDLYKFRPAIAYLLANLQNRYPGTEIYVIINTELGDDVTSSMKTVCDHYNVKYIELKDIEKQWGHSSQKGMKAIVDQVAAALGH